MKHALSCIALMICGSIAFAQEDNTNLPACNSKTPDFICEKIKEDIQLRYVPSENNMYGRYRSFLALEANKERRKGAKVFEYHDFSEMGFLEGQIWLSLSPAKKSEALTVSPERVEQWLMDNAKPEDVDLLLRENNLFRDLPGDLKLVWMTLYPKNRLAALSLPATERHSFIKAHAHEITFDPHAMSSTEFIDSWKLFN